MKRNTHLAHSVEGTEYAAKYDEAAKKLVSNKQVLARIVNETVKEFQGYTIEEIMEGIEEEPEISVKEVYPGKRYRRKDPGAIHGMNTESNIPGEGKITYDIIFYVKMKTKEIVKVIINIELQKDYYPGYHFGSRGVFYCARMLSDQLDKEFFADDYDNMKKVYSIWICMNAPEKDANTITECSMMQKEVYGNYQGEEKCDYLSVVIIRLSQNDNADSNNKLIDMLTTLLSEKMSAETKKKKLESEHNMIMTEEIQGGFKSMCNLAEGLIERTEKRVKKEVTEQLTTQMAEKMLRRGMSIEDVMAYTELPKERIIEIEQTI